MNLEYNEIMNKLNQEKLRRVLFRAADESGEVLERGFRRKKKVMRKADHSLVTDTDFKSEEVIMRHIRKNFPDHAILSEESGGEIGDEYSWLIDSLDGTGNFVRGIPFFSVSIAVLFRRKPILSVVYNPVLDTYYRAEHKKGAYCNKKRIHVNRTKNPNRAILLLNKGRGPQNFRKWLIYLERLSKELKTVRVYGSANLETCLVAQGSFEGYINIGSHIWDQLPGTLIVEEAGGRVTDLEGARFGFGAKEVLATNRVIHRKIFNLLKKN